MPTSLVSPLPDIHLAYEPLSVALQDSGDLASNRTGKSAVEVQLEIEDELESDSWRLIGEFLNPYDYSTDQATVTLHKALQGALGAEPALIIDGGLNPLPGLVKRYRIKVRDVIDGVPAGEFETLDPAYAWQAGRSAAFQHWTPLNGKAYFFLTRFSTRTINPLEQITLQFLALETVSDVDLEITSTYPDGSVGVNNFSVGDITAYQCYSKAGPNPAAFPVTPVKMVVRLIGGFSASQPSITYLVKQNPSPWAQQLYLRNSLGGWDSLYCSGKNQKIMNFSSELFEAQEFPTLPGKQGNSASFNQRANEGYIFRTGFVSEVEQRMISDLLLRNEAWHYFNNQLWPMIITSKSIQEQADGEYLYSAEITARYAFDHHVYS